MIVLCLCIFLRFAYQYQQSKYRTTLCHENDEIKKKYIYLNLASCVTLLTCMKFVGCASDIESSFFIFFSLLFVQ